MTEASYPPALRNPTDVEISLLGEYAPCVCIVRLSGKGVQSVGNSIVLEQDFEHIIDSQPKFPSQSPYILVSRYSENDALHGKMFSTWKSTSFLMKMSTSFLMKTLSAIPLCGMNRLLQVFFYEAVIEEAELFGTHNYIHVPISQVHTPHVPDVWRGVGPEGQANHCLRMLSRETGAFWMKRVI